MTYSTLIISIISVFSLSFGYASVFARSSKTRYRCAFLYILLITVGAACALYEKVEFDRLVDSSIIGIAMAPVLVLWIVVLKRQNKIKTSQDNLEILPTARSSRELVGLSATEK